MKWQTSSRSALAANCVQVRLRHRGWRKSRYSSYNGNCPEIRRARRWVLIRDSKDKRGPKLAVSQEAFGAFVAAVKTGRYDLEVLAS